MKDSQFWKKNRVAEGEVFDPHDFTQDGLSRHVPVKLNKANLLWAIFYNVCFIFAVYSSVNKDQFGI